MNTSLILKINFLVLGLFVVLFLIFQTKQDGLSAEFLQLFGVHPPAQTESVSLLLCKTRVRAIELDYLKASFFQDGFRWIKKISGKESVLHPVEIEKWFSRHCRIGVTFHQQSWSVQSNQQAQLVFRFVKGAPKVIFINTQDGFFGDGRRRFESPQLRRAIQELLELPTDKPKALRVL